MSPAELAELQAEAFAAAPQAHTAFVAEPRDDARGKGDPDRWLEIGLGGPALRRHYHSRRIASLLTDLTGLAWITSGEQGGYSYYRRAGHHLGLHRDIDTCEIAVITCIYDERPASVGSAGSLVVYPSRASESLARIRSAPTEGAIPVALRPGDSLFLLGGQVPHRLLPVAAGHTRIVAPLCFSVAR